VKFVIKFLRQRETRKNIVLVNVLGYLLEVVSLGTRELRDPPFLKSGEKI